MEKKQKIGKPLNFYGVPMPWKLPIYVCDKKVEGEYTQSPGSFGAERKYDVHTGVDLYTAENEPVFSMEDGKVVKVAVFTGPALGHDWWNETFAVMVEGESGVICYGEIKAAVVEGQLIQRGDLIGYVTPVLPEGKERPDIPGHSRSMLHVELYEHGAREFVEWKLGEPCPKGLLDPTDLLTAALV
jgi:murein DD-endopeptidase MepM/ murein hydrolase activator NlpD